MLLARFVLSVRAMAMMRTACSLLALLALGTACTGAAKDDWSDPEPDDNDDPPDIDDPGYPEEAATAILEIYALDIWAQLLPAGSSLSVKRDGQGEELLGFPVVRIAMNDAATYELHLTAADHHDLDVTLTFDGTTEKEAIDIVDATAGHGLSLSHDRRVLHPDEPATPVHTVYLGLRHKWFSAEGRPARRGNQIELLMDGEQAWSRVHGDLVAAQDTIHAATWWWESNFELVRDAETHLGLDPTSRRENTIIDLLDDSPATKRVIVSQFWGQDGLLYWLTADSDIRARGAAGGDDFEFMGQANETSGQFWFAVEPFEFGERVRGARAETAGRAFDGEGAIDSLVPERMVDLTDWPIDVDVEHASYHQKFMVIDGEIAFIGGMNLRRVDWDTSAHRVFEPRRMLFDATWDERNAVALREETPDMGPRKDYMLRIAGPAAQDAAEIFQRRWDLLRAEDADYSEHSSAFTVKRDLPAAAGGAQVQVTATLPDPLWEHAIAESWLAAVSNAERYIFIEDQYFRAPMLDDAIVKRMQEVPGLQLVVITKPVDEWTDPGCEWTAKTHARYMQQFPGRYHLLQLRAFDYAVTWGIDETDSFFQDMDVHSKMLIVDDKFMSVGSANKNNRGMVYEGELNAAVLDPTWVRDQRRRIVANLLGWQPGDDAGVWIEALEDAAVWNDYVYGNWEAEGWDLDLDGDPLPAAYTPDGFVYSLGFDGPDDCFIEGVGPDMT
jgi:hypothetical protein